jgi:chromosome segregation ATPase
MGNLITKYQNFLFEADGINTQIEQTEMEISKVHDEIQLAKEEKSKKPNDINAEIDSIKKQAAAYAKLPTLMTKLSTQLTQKSQQKGSENIY